MKNICLYILLFLFGLNLNAGAPAPSTSLPEPPYIFEKGTLLTAEVDWNKNSLQEFLPNNIELGDIVSGGIDVFFTRHNKPLTKINYVLIWIKKSNNEKILILGFVGPNYDSNRLLEKISEKSLTLAKSRLMLINEKVAFRTNINNKLSFDISGKINSDCKTNTNSSKKIKIDKNKDFLITSISENSCNIKDTRINFAEKYSVIKVKKILKVNLFTDAKVQFSY